MFGTPTGANDLNMYFDLNVPVSAPASSVTKKGKGKQGPITFSGPEINAIEARIELLVHCQTLFPFASMLN